MTDASVDVQIVPVSSRREMARFIRLPARLHADDPHFVPQLVIERREAYSPKKNPYFQHADVQFWLAHRNGRDVGRISAQVDHLQKDPQLGHFGLIEGEDDPRIFNALFSTAEAWLKQHGRTRIQGPFNLSINEETGLLIKGFDTPPMLLMGHDHAYAGTRVEEQGYKKAKDLIAYLYDIQHPLPQAVQKMIARRKPTDLQVRTLDMRHYREEVFTMMHLYNDAWSENWGFMPFTDAEIGHMASSMRPLLDPKLCSILEMRGQMVGFGLTLPNLNEAIADFGGRVLPFNWAKLVWRIKVKHLRTGRTLLMGVSRRFATTGVVGAMAPFLLVDKMRQRAAEIGMEHSELSWILEDNMPMRRINEAVGSDPYKVYRIYEKMLA
ncbi:MAG TPA: dATP pyrophosphohydrolase [Nevskiaceae bacterium]|nr:dATP pyrophosphohydrolase [Nevskiaceae bacterium]